MNDVPENEDEETEEPEEGGEDFEGEAPPDASEGSLLEEASLPEDRLPPHSSPTSSCVSDIASELERRRDSYLERRSDLLREKWLSVAGRKPKSIPVVKKLVVRDELQTFFGDRSPTEVETRRQERWMKILAQERAKDRVGNSGNVVAEHLLPAGCNGVLCVRYDPSGRSMSTSLPYGVVQMRDVEGQVTANLKVLESPDKYPVRGLRYHPHDGDKLYVGGTSGVIQLYDTESNDLLGASERMDAINNVDVSPDGYTLVATGINGLVCIMDSATLQIVSLRQSSALQDYPTAALDDGYHRNRVFGLAFNPMEPNAFVTGGWDRTVKIWDVRMPMAAFSIKGPLISGEAIDVKDNVIATGSWVVDNALQLWEFPSGRLIKTVPVRRGSKTYDGDFLYCVRYFHDLSWYGGSGNLVCVGGGGGSGTVNVINVENGQTLATFRAHKSVSALDTLSNMVTYGGKESLLRVGEVDLPRKKPPRAAQ